jgi:hypothetical protein
MNVGHQLFNLISSGIKVRVDTVTGNDTKEFKKRCL